MIPRHFYAPVEEVCYNLFAEIGSSNSDKKSKRVLSGTEKTVLKKILLVINLIGTILTIFGYAYSNLLLDILYGEKGNSRVYLNIK